MLHARSTCPAVFLMLAAAGCAPSGGFRVTPIPADQTLEERVVLRESAWPIAKVAIVDIDGILLNEVESGLFGATGENPVSLVVEKLEAAARDSRVRAVVLRINSPGGTVTASDILYQEITRFRATTKKPVVAMLMDVAASGGYYAACGADYIVAQPTTVTGSIGVIMQTVSFAETMAKIGVKAEAIVSGPMKDAGSPFRDMKPEERKVFQEIISGLYGRFLEVVRAGRPGLSDEKMTTIADGRVYTAKQALEAGLIDRIGTLRDAISEAKNRARAPRANTIVYGRPLSWSGTAYAAAAPPRTYQGFSLTINASWGLKPTPRFLYLWILE